MRAITRQGWLLIAIITITVFWWWGRAPRYEADVPSYREHRQGAILRDSDIESPARADLRKTFTDCEKHAPPGHLCVVSR